MLIVKLKMKIVRASTISQQQLYTQTNLGRSMKWDFGDH